MAFKFKSKEELPSSGGTFLKLKDGEAVTGVFRGEMYEFCEKWEDKKRTIVSADEHGAKFRFRVNFVVWEGGKFVSKIFEQGKTVYLNLSDLNETCDLETTKVRISRRGSGPMDTEYSILPDMKSPLTASQLNQIENTELQELEHKDAKPTHDDAPMPGDDEIPF